MTLESKGIICEEDPQQMAFKEAVSEWASGKIDYEKLMEFYPSYLLRPHERIVRFIKQTFENLRSPQH